jgi:hypothetical protein
VNPAGSASDLRAEKASEKQRRVPDMPRATPIGLDFSAELCQTPKVEYRFGSVALHAFSSD